VAPGGERVRPILRYPGAKWRLADWIDSYIPPHDVYLEPFFGSGAVFFNKLPSQLETINDINGDVVNLFRILRDSPDELARLIELTPWAREEYLASYEPTDNELERARRFMVRCWQARATRIGFATGWRHDVKGRLNTSCPRTWNELPTVIQAVAGRLKLAQIEQQPAIELIQRYAYPGVLIYADPPYPVSTRQRNIYAEEMTDADHVELLNVLKAHPGPVLLSSYENELYNEYLSGWRKTVKQSQAEAGKIATEVLWLNEHALPRQMTVWEQGLLGG